MSKIVFFCIPAHGHTNPTLGVVRELISRNNEVWYYSYESMRNKIEETGAHFIPCDAYDPQIHLKQEDVARLGHDLAFSTNLIVDITLALDDAIIDDMKSLQPDVIVSDSMAFWGKLIAKKMNIQFVSSTTTFAFNRYSAKVMKQGGAGIISMLWALPKINHSLNRLRTKGYNVKSVLDIIANDNNTNTIVYTSQKFQPCADTFSDSYTFVGPILREPKEQIEKDDRPMVYISLGTVDNNNQSFYRNCMTALTGEDYRVIISVGENTDIEALGCIPKNCIVGPYVDQPAVLSVTDIFLTHCGMNSVSEALYYGVPLVLYPLTPEQQGVANRVHELGAGRFLKGTSPEEIQDIIKNVLNNASIRDNAKIISDSFHRCGGAKAAADFIEGLL